MTLRQTWSPGPLLTLSGHPGQVRRYKADEDKAWLDASTIPSANLVSALRKRAVPDNVLTAVRAKCAIELMSSDRWLLKPAF
jgi:hypothetical protein